MRTVCYLFKMFSILIFIIIFMTVKAIVPPILITEIKKLGYTYFTVSLLQCHLFKYSVMLINNMYLLMVKIG